MDKVIQRSRNFIVRPVTPVAGRAAGAYGWRAYPTLVYGPSSFPPWGGMAQPKEDAPMPYIRIELEFLNHPKTITLPPLAQLLFFRSIIYCAKHLTDGVLPQASPLLLGYDMQGEVKNFVENLENIGWWKPLKGGGWQIHDYLDHQLSRADVTQLIEKKKKAGQAGGQASAQARAIADAQAQSNDSSTNSPAESNISVSVSVPLDVSVAPAVTLKEKIKSSAEVKTSAAPKSVEVWASYSKAYQQKYGVLPVRNQTVNAQLCQLVKAIGLKEAVAVAAFYLTCNKYQYTQNRHPVGLLLKDATGLHTQWLTGIKATTSEARNAEFKDNVVGQADRIIANMEKRGTS